MNEIIAYCVAGWPVFIFVGVLDYIVQKILNILDGIDD